MLILDVQQLSDEWFLAKTGTPSASNFDKIVTSKGEPSKQSNQYLYQLAGERITGLKSDTYKSPAMERGIMLEQEARDLFEFMRDVEVEEVGLCYPNEDKLFSCSPDGLMAISGLEIKCPLIHTHVGFLLNNKLPTKYIPQVQGSMLVTGFQSWFFMSYYPALPPLIVEVPRDEVFCGKLKFELDKFCHKLDEVELKLLGD